MARKTHEVFVKEVYELVGNEYEVKSKYVVGNSKLEMFHVTCCTSYKVTPTMFLIGQRCPNCKKVARHEDFINKLNTKFPNEYTVMGTYINTETKLLVKHNTCLYEWNVYPGNLLSRQSKCPNCSKKKTFTTEEFNVIVNDISEGEYEHIGEYIMAHTPTKFLHVVCGKTFSISPHEFKTVKMKCPKCNKAPSKGETKISEWLKINNINYTVQFHIDECRDKKPLSFDFAIFKDNELGCLIEYDGEHHFKPTDFPGRGQEWAEDQFVETKKRDQIKNTYCKNNNIELIRIPYWEKDNIDLILNNLTIIKGL